MMWTRRFTRALLPSNGEAFTSHLRNKSPNKFLHPLHINRGQICRTFSAKSVDGSFVFASDEVISSELRRLSVPVPTPTVDALPDQENCPDLIKIRHTAAHVMAMAVQRLYPSAKVTIGPWIENGFYYDFLITDKQLSVEDLNIIKKEMDKIIKANLPIVREDVQRDDIKNRILLQNEPYKLEILNDIKDSNISVYHIGQDWWDLCAGPHVESTGNLDSAAISLESVAGSYWRGNEKNLPMLQRVYGTAWLNKEQLKKYKTFKEEALRRDHRTLGQKLDLFSIQEDAGGGLVFWHPKGSRIRKCIEDYWKNEHLKAGYELVYSPHIANVDLWHTSGHMQFYKKDMFNPISVDDESFMLKPMNCPFHCLMYKNEPRSYKQLPIRWAELGTVYRYERSGTLHGLMRVRGFTQDDAHVFCLPSQLEDEICSILDLVEKILNRFGFNRFDISLSTRPDESVGSDEIWELATKSLLNALNRKNLTYSIDKGGGAFYGPKIDIKIRDAIGRKWQCSTIQCDFNLPSRFKLEYTASDGAKQQPVMVHRAIFGSLERFFGILLESTIGEFPLWLAPEQLRLLPVTDDALVVCKKLKEIGQFQYGLRVEIDESGERLPKQVRNAELSRVPLMAIIGKKELQSPQYSISLRSRKGLDLGLVSAEHLFAMMKDMIESK